MESGGIDHRELRDMIDHLTSLFHLDKHVSGKEAMPRIFRDDANWNPLGGICSDKTILNKKIPALQVSE
jgi:hypothetical protein